MALIPYLYAAFYRYQTEGIPPVKGLPYAYGDDRQTYDLADQYLLGEDLLVAPLLGGQTSRRVYLPAGEWFNFWSGRPCPCGWQETEGEHIPVFVRGGTILPFAQPMASVDEASVFLLQPVCYGDCADSRCLLLEDDGHTVGAPGRSVFLTVDGLPADSRRYQLDAFYTPEDYFLKAKERLHEEGR